MSTTARRTVDSPVGPIGLSADGDALVAVRLPRPGSQPEETSNRASHPVLDRAEAELGAYFDGRLRHFSVPVAMSGTPFQEEVWRALLEIPFGEVRSYGWVASRIGRAGASRAVGAANGRNPLGIVVPCHRVIGADGSLTGYGGGLDAKRWLLRHEGALEGRLAGI